MAELAPAPGRTIAFLEGGYDLAALRASAGATASVLAGAASAVADDEGPSGGGPGIEIVARTARGAQRLNSSRIRTTSSSVVGEKSRYHCPMAAKGDGIATHTTARATWASSATVVAGATGTARTTEVAPAARATRIAARRRAARRDAVVHHDHRPILQRHARTSGPQPFGAPCELGLLPGLDRRELLVGHVPGVQHVVLEHTRAAFAERTHGQLGSPGCTELAHDDHVERSVDRTERCAPRRGHRRGGVRRRPGRRS